MNRRARAAIAIGVGFAAALLAYWTRAHVTGFSDFDAMWLAGRAVLHRADPFAAVRAGYAWPLLYPMPAVVATLPFALVPETLAAALWAGVGFGVLAFALTRDARWPLIALASLPAVEAAQLAQWSPILTGLALLPALSFLAACKPTTGGAIALAYLPRTFDRRALALALSLVVASGVLVPTWVWGWRDAAMTATHLRPMILRPFGWVLLLALIKWRRPEARLIALLAIVPQAGMAYDALPLVLVPRSQREAMILALVSFVVVPWQAVATDAGAGFTSATAHNAPLYLAALYVPALVMVLRRPNCADPAIT